MARRGPLSAAHKAAISAGLKRYHAARKSGGGGGSRTPGNAKAFREIKSIDTGKTISREEAARIMFGSAGAAKRLAGGKKVRK